MQHEDLIQPGKHSVTYSSYLKVPELLKLQEPLTTPPQHDEMLFIIIHQVYELWFKQILHEVMRAEETLQQDQPMAFLRIAKRISTIQAVLTHQVDVLETMTPVDFNSFRSRLNPASGFQSMQFRLLEYKLGAKDETYLKFHRLDQDSYRLLSEALPEPSLYDRFLQLLARRGFAVPTEVLTRDVRMPYAPHEGVRDAILAVYRQADKYYDLYATLEALLDIDEGLLLWRQRHVVMVERMIGAKKGTGGSSGVKYLSMTLSKRFFPEIWEARNFLGEGEYGQHPNAGPNQS